MADPASSTVPCNQLAVPRHLESPRAKQSYLTLSVTQGAGTSELRSVLGTSSLRTYPVLWDHRRTGPIERTGDGSLRVVGDETSTAGGV